MGCDCTSSTKYIPIKYIRAMPVESGKIEDVIQKGCHSHTDVKVQSKGDNLLVHLEFENTLVTAVEVFGNFKRMKIFFSEISLRNYKKQREDHAYDLKPHHSEYRCKKSAVEMTFVFEEGNELYFLKIKGNAPGIVHAVDTKYELVGTDKLIENKTQQNFFVGH